MKRIDDDDALKIQGLNPNDWVQVRVECQPNGRAVMHTPLGNFDAVVYNTLLVLRNVHNMGRYWVTDESDAQPQRQVPFKMLESDVSLPVLLPSVEVSDSAPVGYGFGFGVRHEYMGVRRFDLHDGSLLPNLRNGNSAEITRAIVERTAFGMRLLDLLDETNYVPSELMVLLFVNDAQWWIQNGDNLIKGDLKAIASGFRRHIMDDENGSLSLIMGEKIG